MIALGVVLGGCLLGTHPPQAPVRDASLGLAISTFTAPNGLRTVLVSDPAATEVQVTMRYQVGAADDPPEQAGEAHFVEHLMFEQRVGDESLAEHLARIATFYNGFTTLDATTYVARARPDRLEELLAIEAARLTVHCSAVAPADLSRERDVVLNEIRARETAQAVVEGITEAVYPAGHPYHRSVGGTVASVSAITREQACAFADAHYAVGNAVLVVSGNLSRERLEATLAKNLAALPRQEAAASTAVSRPAFHPGKVEISVPVDHESLVIAWPAPEDGKLLGKYTALLATAAAMIDDQIRGSASMIELGDVRAPMIGLLVSGAKGELYTHLVNMTDEALSGLPKLYERNDLKELDPLEFGRTQHAALDRTYDLLDRPEDRDQLLANAVAAGRDPRREVHELLAGIYELTRAEAMKLAHERFAYDRALVIAARPDGVKRSAAAVKVVSRIDDPEPRRPQATASDARRPAAFEVPTEIPRLHARRLANGLSVVTIPSATVPTIDIRLVFRAGSGDEPAAQRGLASLASHALTWNAEYVKDLILYATAGAVDGRQVTADGTSFEVRGTSDQLDFLLAGLRRWVRDGRYDESVDEFAGEVSRARARPDEAALLTDAVQAALYGDNHPYATAGELRHASDRLDDADAIRFRNERYTPDNATLIVTGHFDPAVVDRWIDYLFADWTGHAVPRDRPVATPHAASFARVVDRAQIELWLGIPATAGGRAEQLVAAQMLAEIARAVRYELGASYELDAKLVEGRLATHYAVGGGIDATRAPAAIKLVADRLSELHRDPEAAARLFVIARDRVIAQLSSVAGGTEALADRVARAVVLGRAPDDDLAAAGAVRALTIDRMTTVLGEVELSRAVIAMTGPLDDIQRAFAVLGRKPQIVESAVAPAETSSSGEVRVHAYRDTVPHHLADPITSPSSPLHFVLDVDAGVALATITRTTIGGTVTDDCVGPSLSAAVGYRGRRDLRVGLQLGYTNLSGSDVTTGAHDTYFHLYNVGPFVQLRLHERFWAGALFGVHVEQIVRSQASALFAGELGIDLIPIGRRWLGIYGRYEVDDETLHGTGIVGVAYRD